MNERQRRFADEYIKTGNAYQSAIKAGYSETYANNNISKLLGNVGIKNYIDDRMRELRRKNIMDAEEALSILSDIARGKRYEEVLMMNPVSGEVERHTKKADNATVIKAVTEILKRYPTAKQSEKLELELSKLRTQLESSSESNLQVTIVDRWEEDNDSN